MQDKTQKIIDSLKESGLEEIFDLVESKFSKGSIYLEGSIYLVGGSIRNALMGLKINDLDFSTPLNPKEILELLEGENLRTTGIDFGTVSWSILGHEVEITTFRCDETYENHRRPKGLKFGKSKQEDLARRDFTINALMYSSQEGIYDPFDGVSDIEAGVIKAVGDPEKRFKEDALRILRLFRFHLNYGFKIDQQTLGAAKRHFNLIYSLSKERVVSEVKKTFKSEVHLNKLINLLKVLLGVDINPVHGLVKKKLNLFDQVYYFKKIKLDLKSYLFEKSYKRIYDLYVNLENSKSLLEYQKFILNFIKKNKLNSEESINLWLNAKYFGTEHSKKIKEFKPGPLRKERVAELRALHSDKALGEKLFEEELKEYFLVDGIE